MIGRAFDAARLRRKTEAWSVDSGVVTVTWDVPARGAFKQLPPEAQDRLRRLVRREREKGPGPSFKQLPPKVRECLGNGVVRGMIRFNRGTVIFRFTGAKPIILTP